MAEVLTFTREDWEDIEGHHGVLERMVWEDTPFSGRWDEYHNGVFEWDGKHYWASWSTGLTEYQENDWFDADIKSDGSISFKEAESYEVIETKWRRKK